MIIPYLLFFGTFATAGIALYLIHAKTELGKKPTCMLCGKELNLQFEDVYAEYNTIIEKEHTCEQCASKNH
ncbi:hypothetical protein [Thalassobacillus hwangdonensis]|uniref:Uncharacterized protein n=1 Tax=Thalassobacillus hwangdonensis TaxID=546108 RepID=A0ABW3L1X0_9BACI